MTTLPAHPKSVTAANRPRVKTLDKLDAIRGFAAIYVMLSHLSSNHLHLQRSWLGQPFRFAQEGVLLFFLLSGFVIYYSWDLNSGRKSFSTFFYKRFRRIYPIFFLALLLAFVISGGKYPFHFWNLAGNLFMLQGFEADHGFRAVPFMGNGPLWSLSYEWWFYMLFFLLYRYFSVRLQRAAVMVLGLIGVAGEYFAPNIFFSIVASFPIWWCGVEFAREYIQTGNFTLRRQRWTIGSLFVIGLAYAAVSRAWTHSGGVLNVIEYPLVKGRHYLVAIVLIFLFFVWKRTRFAGFDVTIGPFRAFAGISYAIYVFHFPIICNLTWPIRMPLLVDVGLRIGLVLILAYFAERVYQQSVGRFMDLALMRLRPTRDTVKLSH